MTAEQEKKLPQKYRDNYQTREIFMPNDKPTAPSSTPQPVKPDAGAKTGRELKFMVSKRDDETWEEFTKRAKEAARASGMFKKRT